MSMLDLNVNIINTNDDSTFVQKELQLLTFPPEITESRTSNTFDLLKKEKDVTEFYNIERVKEENTAQTITRNLFPVSADRGGRVYDSMNQRLNFDDQNGLRILQQKKHQVLKTRRGPRSRSSQYRGVTFYRRTGRWESHIWDCGKQVYLGGFDTAHAAARAYDRAAVMFRGVDADINFIFTDYEEDLKQMRGLSKEECVLRLRKQTNGISTYRSALALQKYGQGDPPITPFVGKTFCHKPSTTSKGDMIANSNKACTLHNLDLTLGISPSSKILNNNDCGDGVSFGYRAGMIPKERGTMEKALVNIKRDVPFQVFSDLALQFCSNGNIALGSLQSKAASSGFVSSSTCFIAHTSNYLT